MSTTYKVKKPKTVVQGTERKTVLCDVGTLVVDAQGRGVLYLNFLDGDFPVFQDLQATPTA
jgi:hypothetical protein